MRLWLQIDTFVKNGLILYHNLIKTVLIDISTRLFYLSLYTEKGIAHYLMINSPTVCSSLYISTPCKLEKMTQRCVDVDPSPTAQGQHRHNAAAASRVC